jgi:hypothetical protein
MALTNSLRRSATGLRRAEACAARNDKRAWVMQRRERTRHLIELGGLVQKAGLVELVDDDRATLLGGLLAFADMLSGEGGHAQAEVWRRRGLRAFDADSGAG